MEDVNIYVWFLLKIWTILLLVIVLLRPLLKTITKVVQVSLLMSDDLVVIIT